jgi:sterol 3beta-glucosyltransferase
MGFNRHLIPTTQIPKDWPKEAAVCGFLFVPRTPEEEVAQELRDFVSSAERPPVYLGFGSMPAPNPKALLQAAIQVVKQLDCWAVLCAGWTSLSDLIEYEKDSSSSPPGTTSSKGKVIVPKRLLIIKAAPHDWLFPRCSAIVHHCGVGTTGAALRSGSPSVPCPVMLDQPFFGSQLHNLGVGTEPIPFPDLTLPKLLNALRIATTNPQMKERAVNIARDIEEEEKVRGVRHVVNMLESGKPLSFWK